MAATQVLRDPHTFAVELRQVGEFALVQPRPAAKERGEPVVSLSSSVPKLRGLQLRQVLRERSVHVS
jgi:hypothetical protein